MVNSEGGDMGDVCGLGGTATEQRGGVGEGEEGESGEAGELGGE